METDITYMKAALEEAKAAAMRDEVPVGAVLVHAPTGRIAAAAGNRTVGLSDPSAHGEILVLRAACAALGAQRLPEYDLYVTLEPCTMCAAAASFARIRRLVIGAPDPKGGGVLHGAKFYDQPTCHHRPCVESGPLEKECADILKTFFKEKRKRED